MNKYLKLLFFVLMNVAGIYLINERQVAWGVIVLIFSIFPLLLFFRNEYILLAFWQIRKQNLEKAKYWLDKITNYRSQLIRNQYGYYHYLMGICESQSKINKAEMYLKKALEYGLTFAHDKALAHLNLSMAALAKGRKIEAEKHLNLAKKFDKAGMLSEQIQLIKEQKKRLNVGRNLQNPHMRIKR